MSRVLRIGSIFAILAAFTLCSCRSDAPSEQATGEDGETVIVSAASSTRDLIEALAKEFETAAGTEVKVNTGSSNALAGQILAGAPASMFLSASTQWADEVEQAGLSTAKVRLLTSRLVIVVPQGNPGGVQEPQDLLRDKVRNIAIAGDKVPAGMYAEQALRKLNLWQPLTDANKFVRGQDVRSALSYVERGEAEAGIVYSTDASIAPAVTTVYQFDSSLHEKIAYVLVLLKHGSEQQSARDFYEFLQSTKADESYRRFGFSRLH
jgi:molybdate transport system substrate-binding protein